MAEAALVVQFFDSAVTCLSLLNRAIRTIKHASAELQSLSAEASRSERFLLCARRAVSGCPIPANHPISITDLSVTAEKLNNKLRHAVEGLQKEYSDKVHLLKWIFEKTKCKNLEIQVRQHREHIADLIQVLYL